MSSDRYDLIILGSGSTAFAAALRAETYGVRTLMIEKSVPGGTCINWGCVPSKTLIHGALFAEEARRGEAIGVGTSFGSVDDARLNAHKVEVVRHLRKSKYSDILEQIRGLTLVKGTGRLVAPDTVQVGEETYLAKNILIATGGNPRVPPFPGLETIPYLTSRSALLMRTFPRSLVVVGGGVVALELGQMYHRLGTKVTILESGTRLLPALADEPAAELRRALTEEGLELLFGVCVTRFATVDGESAVFFTLEGEERELRAEQVLLALGTSPATDGIGLHRLGVELDGRGFVKTDEFMRTSVPGIWAAGDVNGGMMIATVGAREGMVAVDDMFNRGCGCRMDHMSAPMAIFTDPEVGMVGYMERQAREAGFDPIMHSMRVDEAAKAHITAATAGAVTMVADRQTRRILGIHLVAHRGADIINEAALAVRFRLTIEDLASSLHVYPSMGEILKLCALGFSRNLAHLSCCAE